MPIWTQEKLQSALPACSPCTALCTCAHILLLMHRGDSPIQHIKCQSWFTVCVPSALPVDGLCHVLPCVTCCHVSRAAMCHVLPCVTFCHVSRAAMCHVLPCVACCRKSEFETARPVPAGTSSSCSLWQRISVMQVMRQLCADAYFLHFLFVTYDAKEVRSVPERAFTTQLGCCWGFIFVLQHLYSHLLRLHGGSVMPILLPCTWLACLKDCVSKEAHSAELRSAPMCTSTLTLTSASWAAAVNSKGDRSFMHLQPSNYGEITML